VAGLLRLVSEVQRPFLWSTLLHCPEKGEMVGVKLLEILFMNAEYGVVMTPKARRTDA
jgi:hypothetical protein